MATLCALTGACSYTIPMPPAQVSREVPPSCVAEAPVRRFADEAGYVAANAGAALLLFYALKCSFVDERCGTVTAGGAWLAASATGALSSIFVEASRTGKQRVDLCRRVKEHHYDLLQLE